MATPIKICGIKLGNLRNDLQDSQYVKHIKDIFLQIGVGLSGKNIRLKDSNSGKTVTAFITLKSLEVEKHAENNLLSPTIQIKALLQNIESHVPMRIEACNAERNKSLAQFPSAYSGMISDANHVQLDTQDTDENEQDSDEGKFIIGQELGNETRNQEFKLGQGGYLNHVFRSDLEKYVCGFLNSEGGSLYIGVDDAGVVIGVSCTHQEEDNIKKLADQVMRNFKPPVSPDMYSLEFHPVFDKLRNILVDKKIVEVIVKEVSSSDALYESWSGQVFMRRDGSTEIMKPHEIQAWVKRHAALDGKGGINYDEKEMDRLKKSHENLKRLYAELVEKKTQSCACVII